MTQPIRQNSYTDIDIYGRGFDGVFGPGAEDATRRAALLRMKEIRDARAIARAESYVDYDLYGRGDPRVFGVNAHIANAEQAAQNMPHTRNKNRKKISVRAILRPSKKRLEKFVQRFSPRFAKEKETDEIVPVESSHPTVQKEVSANMQVEISKNLTTSNRVMEAAEPNVAQKIRAFDKGEHKQQPSDVVVANRATPFLAKAQSASNSVSTRQSSTQTSSVNSSRSSAADSDVRSIPVEVTPLLQGNQAPETPVIRSIETPESTPSSESVRRHLSSGIGNVTEKSSGSQSSSTTSSRLQSSAESSGPDSDATESSEDTSNPNVEYSKSKSFSERLAIFQSKEAEGSQDKTKSFRQSGTSSSHSIAVEYVNEEVIVEESSSEESMHSGDSKKETEKGGGSTSPGSASTSTTAHTTQSSSAVGSNSSEAETVEAARTNNSENSTTGRENLQADVEGNSDSVGKDARGSGSLESPPHSSSHSSTVKSSSSKSESTAESEQEIGKSNTSSAKDSSASDGEQKAKSNVEESSKSSSDVDTGVEDRKGSSSSAESNGSNEDGAKDSNGDLDESVNRPGPSRDGSHQEKKSFTNSEKWAKEDENGLNKSSSSHTSGANSDDTSHSQHSVGRSEEGAQAESSGSTSGEEANEEAAAASKKRRASAEGEDTREEEEGKRSGSGATVSDTDDEEFVDAVDSMVDSDHSEAVTHSTEVVSSSIPCSSAGASGQHSSSAVISSQTSQSSRYTTGGPSTEVEEDGDSDMFLNSTG